MAKGLQKDFLLHDIILCNALHFLFPPATIFFGKTFFFWGGGAPQFSVIDQTTTKELFAWSCCKIIMLRLHFPVPHLAKLTIYFPFSENRVLGKGIRVYLWCTFPISPGRPSSPFLHQPRPIYRPVCRRLAQAEADISPTKKGVLGLSSTVVRACGIVGKSTHGFLPEKKDFFIFRQDRLMRKPDLVCREVEKRER